MHVVNTDGLALVGPGSEWLWTALQFVALAVTGLAIFRQLRAQTWANSMTIALRFSDEIRVELVRPKLVALMDLSSNGRRMTPSIERVGVWFDGMAEAVEHGYVTPELAWQEWGLIGQEFWAAFAPVVEERRKVEPTLWGGWERWVHDLRNRDRDAGVIRDLGPAHVATWIPESIAYYIEILRQAQDDRSGLIPVWPAGETPPSAEG